MFEIGEVYRNPSYPNNILILAIEEESDKGVWLAILWVDPKTTTTIAPGELYIDASCFNDWERQEL